MNQTDLQLLSRYDVPAPGVVKARGDYRLFGAIFITTALLFAAVPLFALAGTHAGSEVWVAFIFGGVFLLLGLWILGIREELEVSPAGVRHVLSTWTSRKERHAPRAAVQAVRLSSALVRAGRSYRLEYAATLIIEAKGFPDTLRVTCKRKERSARRAAEEIARALDVNLEDVIGDERIVVDPGDLDTQRPKRVKTTHLPPAQVRIDPTAQGTSVWIRGTLRPGTAAQAAGAGALVLSMSAVGAALGLSATDDPRFALFLALLFAVPALGFIAWCVVGGKGEERILITPDAVRREIHFAGTSWRRGEIPRQEIEALRVQTRSADGYGLAVVSDRKRLLVGRGLDTAGLTWLRAWIGQELEVRSRAGHSSPGGASFRRRPECRPGRT